MRLDKFLKVSRLIKRRSVAKALADNYLVEVNSFPAKPSKTISVGDEIVIKLGDRVIKFIIKNVLPNASKDVAISMYEIVSDEFVE